MPTDATKCVHASQKGEAGSWGKSRPPQTRSGDGEGWGRDRVAFLARLQRGDATYVVSRLSPSETHTFGSDCDWRFT